VAAGEWGHLAAEGLKDDGWRLQSPSRLARFYGDLGWKGTDAEIHLVTSAADSQTREALLSAIINWLRYAQHKNYAPEMKRALERVSAPGLAARLYFNRYTEDAVDLCDILSSFAPHTKASLNELSKIMGLPGKPEGIDGTEVERYLLEVVLEG
jgi:hypothetical protein